MKTYICILIFILTFITSNSSLQAEWEKADGYEFLKDKTFKGGFKRFVQDGKYLLSRDKDTLYLYETETLNLEKSWVIPKIEDADVSDDLKYLMYGKYNVKNSQETYPDIYIVNSIDMTIINNSLQSNLSVVNTDSLNRMQIYYLVSHNKAFVMVGGSVFTVQNTDTEGGISLMYDFQTNIFTKIIDNNRKYIQNINSNQRIANILYREYSVQEGNTIIYNEKYGWQCIDLESQIVLAFSEHNLVQYFSNIYPEHNSKSVYKSDFLGANGVYNKKYGYFYYQAFPYGKTFEAHGRKQSLSSNEYQKVNNVNSGDAEFFLDDEFMIVPYKSDLLLYNHNKMEKKAEIKTHRKINNIDKVSDSTLYILADSNYLFRINPSCYNEFYIPVIVTESNLIQFSDTVKFMNRTYGGYDSFEWDFGDGSTSKEMNQLHIFKDTGTYQITLSIKRDTLVKMDTAFIQVIEDLTSVSNPSSNNNELVQIIYPNPSNDRLTIELSPQQDSNIKFTFYDLQSNIVLERNTMNGELTHSFNISSFAPGTYFVKVQNGKSIEYKKFIKIGGN